MCINNNLVLRKLLAKLKLHNFHNPICENNKYRHLKGNAEETNTRINAYMIVLDATYLIETLVFKVYHSKSHY